MQTKSQGEKSAHPQDTTPTEAEMLLLEDCYNDDTNAIETLADILGVDSSYLRMSFQDSIGKGIAYFMAWAHGKAISRGRAAHTYSPNRKQRRAWKKKKKR
jgi:hypothetical protein